jgi:hypothetical protein
MKFFPSSLYFVNKTNIINVIAVQWTFHGIIEATKCDVSEV